MAIIPATTTTKAGSHLKPDNYLYKIPVEFPNFGCILNHWYHVVKNRNDSGTTNTPAEKKRFQMIARIMKAFKKLLAHGMSVIDAENNFQEFYVMNKKSIAKLSDIYARSILSQERDVTCS